MIGKHYYLIDGVEVGQVNTLSMSHGCAAREAPGPKRDKIPPSEANQLTGEINDESSAE